MFFISAYVPTQRHYKVKQSDVSQETWDKHEEVNSLFNFKLFYTTNYLNDNKLIYPLNFTIEVGGILDDLKCRC